MFTLTSSRYGRNTLERDVKPITHPSMINTYVCFLACCGKQDVYWIGFVSDFGLYRRQTSQQGTILVSGLVAPNHLVPGYLVPFFRPGHLVPLFGSHRLIFFNGVEIINAILLCVKIYFLNLLLYKKMIFDKMHIGKFII